MPQGYSPDFTALHPGFGVVLLDMVGGRACGPQEQHRKRDIAEQCHERGVLLVTLLRGVTYQRQMWFQVGFGISA